MDLPEYLFPPDQDLDASIVDTEAIEEVCVVSETLQPIVQSIIFILNLVLNIYFIINVKCYYQWKNM